jgi:predicted pyridoxine 5'-phosphate oxidase superfamily flavin-nucleotide-binding protein
MADWKESFREGKELVLSTCSSLARPNANIVISLGFSGGRLMVADCSMATTIKNLKENPRICVIGGYFKIIGRAKIFNSGDVFRKCVEIVASQDKTLKVKNAILVDAEAVFDLENAKKIA